MTDQLQDEVRKLLGQVTHWTPSRWAASSAVGGTRADRVHDLVQWLADRCAEAEGRTRLPVPRLEHDLALPDQLRVVTADLITYGGPQLHAEAAARVHATKQEL